MSYVRSFALICINTNENCRLQMKKLQNPPKYATRAYMKKHDSELGTWRRGFAIRRDPNLDTSVLRCMFTGLECDVVLLFA
jgi:hypothetical protein